MFRDNLIQMRKMKSLTQEALAEKIGVTRQAVAKWESGETEPSLEKAKLLAEALSVSLDSLTSSETESDFGMGIPPKGKHFFGMVTVGDKGQIVIPAKARKLFKITPGDQVMVLGDESTGIAIMKSENFLVMADMIRNDMKGNSE